MDPSDGMVSGAVFLFIIVNNKCLIVDWSLSDQEFCVSVFGSYLLGSALMVSLFCARLFSEVRQRCFWGDSNKRSIHSYRRVQLCQNKFITSISCCFVCCYQKHLWLVWDHYFSRRGSSSGASSSFFWIGWACPQQKRDLETNIKLSKAMTTCNADCPVKVCFS